MTPSLYSLAYMSLATDPAISEFELASILSVSQRKNVDNGLTGALVFAHGRFIQLLEGPLGPLVATLEEIKVDPRHHSLDIIGPGPIEARVFPDWCMVRLTAEPGLEEALAFLMSDWPQRGNQTAAKLSAALEY